MKVTTLPLFMLIGVSIFILSEAKCTTDRFHNKRAMYFDTSSYLAIPDPGSGAYDGTSHFTFSAWIKPDWDWRTIQSDPSNDGRVNIASKWHWPNEGSWAVDMWAYGLDPTRGQNSLMVFISQSASDGGNTVWEAKNYVDAGLWQHVAFTFKKGDVDIYKNGHLVDAELIVLPPNSLPNQPSILHTTNDVLIGQFPGLERNFTGQIDDVALINVALSPEEVHSLYTRGIERTDVNCVRGLKSWFRMGDSDKANSTFVTDEGPLDNTADIHSNLEYPFFNRV